MGQNGLKLIFQETCIVLRMLYGIRFLRLHNKLLAIQWIKKQTNQKFIFLHSGNQKSKINVSKCNTPFGGSRGESFLASSIFWYLHIFFGLFLHHFNLCLHLHIALSFLLLLFCLSQSFLFLYFVRTFVIGFGTHSNNRRWSHLRIRSLITFEKLLFPNNVTFSFHIIQGFYIDTSWGANTKPFQRQSIFSFSASSGYLHSLFHGSFPPSM